MAEKEEISKEKLEHEGVFDFKALYSYAHSWWGEAGYGVTEEEYAEKAGGDSRDVKFKWKVTKDISDYFKHEYAVKMEVERLKDVEVEIDGQRKQMNSGKVKVEITAVLVLDKDGKWESSWSSRFFRDIYNKYVVPSRVDSMKNIVAGKGVQFKDDIKAFLDLTGKR